MSIHVDPIRMRSRVDPLTHFQALVLPVLGILGWPEENVDSGRQE